MHESFFHGLSELRGIAAMAVVVNHIELFKKSEDIPSLYGTWLVDFISTLGKNGVYLFFVLSGFLITYLLSTELETKNEIQIKKFYIRKILRIWPLYYTVVLFCLLVLPVITTYFGDFFGSNYYVDLLNKDAFSLPLRLVTFILFLPNLALIVFPPVAAASQSWSVGVEEQFYLIWPIILNKFKDNILSVLMLVIFTKAALFALVFVLIKSYDLGYLKVALSFLQSFNIELMAFGGIGAIALQRGYIENFLIKVRKYHVWLLISAIIFLMTIGVNYLILGLLFLLLVLFNIQKHSNVTENRLLSFLGDISYGIYMYHPLMMFLSFALTIHFTSRENQMFFNLSFYGLTFGLTILLSFLSFKYFEALFLKFKKNYTVIDSGKG